VGAVHEPPLRVYGKNHFDVMARRPILIWLLFCVVTGAVFLTYAFASFAAGRGEFVLPLDDVYIHFQYAKQIVLGQPYVYNPGQPPTSGATSFLYPYLLAFGYLIGFQELRLSLWAMGIGALALLGSLWLVYRLLKTHDAPNWLAVLVALIFGLTGSIAWHFMSGMETGLMMLFALATLYCAVTQRLRLFVGSASLLALTRPEGGILAAIGVVAFVLGTRHEALAPTSLPHGEGLISTFVRPFALREKGTGNEGHAAALRRHLPLIIPLLMLFVQPLVNLLVTGSPIATGNSVKSIFGTVPFYWDVVIGRILDNFLRMWAEFITGISLREGLYVPYLVGPLALAFLIGGLFSRKYRLVNAMLLLWLLAGTASIATLDTAFWHFKRYQMPLMALLFPAAGWGLTKIIYRRKDAMTQSVGQMHEGVEVALTPTPPPSWRGAFQGRFLPFALREKGPGDEGRRAKAKLIQLPHTSPLRYVPIALYGLGLIIALTTGAAFLGHFALNVGYVYAQPLQMARWLKANTPEDAVVAVHDVGMIRYIGERTTLDMVGLTTPGAAAYWRNGPGSVAEFLIQERPDYIASYGKGHGLGLELIANTRIYGDPLAEFPVDLDPNYNVALAADYQGIYQPDWERLGSKKIDDMGSYPEFLWQTIYVANLASEAEHNYVWSNQDYVAGFPTEVHELSGGENCTIPDCRLILATRRLNGEETFTFNTTSGYGVDLMTVVHPINRGTLDVFVNDEFVDRLWVPETPGRFFTLVTRIPAQYISGESIRVRIKSNMENGFYYPAAHLALEYSDGISTSVEAPSEDQIQATFQNRSLVITGIEVSEADNLLTIDASWYSDGNTEGDYRFFVHLYWDISQPPIAQTDIYLYDGTAPPGNLPLAAFDDTYSIDLSPVPPGIYKLAIGFYNPYTGERLMPESDVYEVSADGRLWLDDVVVPGE
jgi:hypothetical protein